MSRNSFVYAEAGPPSRAPLSEPSAPPPRLRFRTLLFPPRRRAAGTPPLSRRPRRAPCVHVSERQKPASNNGSDSSAGKLSVLTIQRL